MLVPHEQRKLPAVEAPGIDPRCKGTASIISGRDSETRQSDAGDDTVKRADESLHRCVP